MIGVDVNIWPELQTFLPVHNKGLYVDNLYIQHAPILSDIIIHNNISTNLKCHCRVDGAKDSFSFTSAQ